MDFAITFINVVALVSLAALGVVSLLRSNRKGAMEIGYCALSGFVWCACLLAESLSDTFETKLFWKNASQIGAFALPPGIVAFSMVHWSKNQTLRRVVFLVLIVAESIPLALILTDQGHHLMRSSIELKTSLTGQHFLSLTTTPLSRFLVSLNYVYLAFGCLTLAIYALRSEGLVRKSAWMGTIGITIPVVFSFFKNAIPWPEAAIAMTTSGFAIGVLITLYGVIRVGFIGLGPIGIDKTFLVVSEGILIFDPRRTLVLANPAATELLHGFDLLGNGSRSLTLDSRLYEQIPFDDCECPKTIRIVKAGPEATDVFLSCTTYSLDSRANPVGYTVVLRDVSAEVSTLQTLTRRSEIDELTGAYNKKTFTRYVTRALEDQPETGALLVFDIDRFKQVNDTRGHLVGDAVLSEVCRRCRRILRDTDLLGRVGGDEFAILLWDVDHEEIQRLAERIRASVDSERMIVAGHESLGITISLGGTPVRRGDSFGELFGRADEALYGSKRQGRNRVSLVFGSDNSGSSCPKA